MKALFLDEFSSEEIYLKFVIRIFFRLFGFSFAFLVVSHEFAIFIQVILRNIFF